MAKNLDSSVAAATILVGTVSIITIATQRSYINYLNRELRKAKFVNAGIRKTFIRVAMELPTDKFQEIAERELDNIKFDSIVRDFRR